MKTKAFSSIGAFALALAALAGLSSCEVETIIGQEREPMAISISSEGDAALKSTLYDKAWAMFEAGDKISVFDGTYNNGFTTEKGGISALFTGEAIPDLEKYWFLYPYQTSAKLSKDNNLITATVPSAQTAKANDFDSEALLSVGIGTASSAVLKNVCALLKFTINDGADVKTVRLKGSSPLAGNVVVSASDGTVVSAESAVNEIVMTGGFVDGTTYYIAALPGTQTNLELSAEDSSGNTTSKSSDSFTIERSKTHDLGYIGAVSQIKGNPLCFVAEKDNSTVTLKKNGSGDWMLLDYSTDGATWSNYKTGTIVNLPKVGDQVAFRNRYTYADVAVSAYADNYYCFSLSGKVAAQGNIMSLLCKNMEVDTVPSYCFYRMFEGCTVLTSAPELPAQTLSSCCYWGMFHGCSGLISAPKLPATALNNYCYCQMFENCTSLTESPKLPATTLAEECYSAMFKGCASLITPPELPATRMQSHCYYEMFRNCTSLVTPPELPATILAAQCYFGMFRDCENLESAPFLPAAQAQYHHMFEKCKKINYIEISATSGYYGNWLTGTAEHGTVVCPSSFHAAGLVNDNSDIPNGWVVINNDLEGPGVGNEIFTEGSAVVWK